jgi:multiple sugar transport system permease protein
MSAVSSTDALELETVTGVDRRKPARDRSQRFTAKLAGRYLLLLVVLMVTVGPFLWELSTSFKGRHEDINTATPHLIPQHPTFASYAKVSRTIPVWHYFENSLFVASLCVVGNIIGATVAGYALARLQFRGRNIVLGLFLSTLVLPGEVTIISQFQTVNRLGFANSLIGVALPGMIAALNVLLMRQAFLAIPQDVDFAAIVDGANVWERFRYIGLPSVKGTLSVIAIFAFIGAWDDFLWPLLVLQDPSKYTLTVGLAYLDGIFGNDPRTVAAGTMIALLPIVVLFACLQRYFFRGVGEGAVKG